MGAFIPAPQPDTEPVATAKKNNVLRRRSFLLAALAAGVGASFYIRKVIGPPQWAPGSSSVPVNEYLRGLAAAVIEAARVRPGQTVLRKAPNTTGATLIRPGGRNDYPACWVRDFAMSLDCGLIPADEVLHHLHVFARAQHGSELRRLKGHSMVPPFAIPDHVNFDGSAVFFPGTYSSGDDQGNGGSGLLPPLDDQYYFIHIAHHLLKAGKDPSFLLERIKEVTLLDRILKAFDVPRTDEVTGAVVTELPNRAVGFGFFDSVLMTGSMLFPTLLRYQAAQELKAICQVTGRTDLIPRFNQIMDQIATHLPMVFAASAPAEGWLKAATGFSGQPDVWGTLMALRMNILPEAMAQRARATIAQAVRDGTIEYNGAVRHVPTNHDAAPDTAWERTGAPLNTYQNGAYWHTPTGWLITALRPYDHSLAEKVLARYAKHLRAQDFRQGEDFGAPWECFGPEDGTQKNPVYLTSVTVPLAVLSGL